MDARHELFWCDATASRNTLRDKSLLLDEVTDIFVGKRSAAFENGAGREAVEENCFSIGAAWGTLDLESDSLEIRRGWVDALASRGWRLGDRWKAAQDGARRQPRRVSPSTGRRFWVSACVLNWVVKRYSK